MSLPSGILTPDEQILLDIRPHWSRFVAPGTAVVLAFAAWVKLSLEFDGFGPKSGSVLLLVSSLWLLAVFAPWWFTCFAVTTERVIVRSGIVAKNGVEIPLDRINTVFFRQSVLERLLRAGDLSIESASEQGRQEFKDVADPNRVQQEIYRAKEGQQARVRELQGEAVADALPKPPATTAVQSPAQELERVWGLRQSGAISEQEYQELKGRILS